MKYKSWIAQEIKIFDGMGNLNLGLHRKYKSLIAQETQILNHRGNTNLEIHMTYKCKKFLWTS